MIQPIGYIGNSRDGKNPFGCISDIRAYPIIVTRNMIDNLSNYHEDLEFDMPDKYCCNFVELGMIKTIIDEIDNYARADTKRNLIKVLAMVATHRDCRAYILKYNGLQKAMELSQDNDPTVQYEAMRLLCNLE